MSPSTINTSTSKEEEQLPYWQVNVPPSERTAVCPPFLRNISPKDREILSTPDLWYQTESWPDVKKRVASNQLEGFRRLPSDLRRYLEYNYCIKEKYGSLREFILRERLGWDEDSLLPKTNESGYLWNQENVKFIQNDWPYGIDNRIVHLVVWLKFGLEADSKTGMLTAEAKRELDGFVKREFVDCDFGMDGDDIIWFKNWRSIQSIESVEHFHVMLFDPDPGFVDRITGGYVPLWKRRSDERTNGNGNGVI
ncbi:hypothetical protein B0H66DRAFT_596556 [Apodospora peruviana]|uniref:N-acetylglucosamine-induced protein 1 n=1 Tax=Apodospora peruviana TaxID=516989 RepID=A0AAE0IPU0_9PEZI|nr:hypothetical protein B0H66DRAFT_596556 [Apodospora peruviana]